MAKERRKGPIKVKLAWLEPGYEVVARMGSDVWSMSTTEARKLAIDLRLAADTVERDRS
jgi:hypothetical protein